MEYVFSFALGNIWRWSNSKNRSNLLSYVKKLDISGVELTFSTKEELFAFSLSKPTKKWLQNLEYVTIHAPFRLYQDAENEEEVIKQINMISKIYHDLNCKNVIIHPETKMFDLDLLNECEFEISVENLPQKSAISILNLREIFDKYSHIKFCLDISHAYSWSKFETRKLIEAFQDRISQIHFSGSYRKRDHQSLRKVSKAFLFSIQPIKQLKVPIVIEEDMAPNSLEYIKGEIEYIKNFFFKGMKRKGSHLK